MSADRVADPWISACDRVIAVSRAISISVCYAALAVSTSGIACAIWLIIRAVVQKATFQ